MPPFDADTPEVLYAELRPLLLRYAVKRFGIPGDVAEELIQDVFVSYVSRRGDVIDPRAWLIGAVSHACAHHRRKNEEKLAPEPQSDETASWLRRIALRAIDAYARLCRLLSPRHSSIQR